MKGKILLSGLADYMVNTPLLILGASYGVKKTTYMRDGTAIIEKSQSMGATTTSPAEIFYIADDFHVDDLGILRNRELSNLRHFPFRSFDVLPLAKSAPKTHRRGSNITTPKKKRKKR